MTAQPVWRTTRGAGLVAAIGLLVATLLTGAAGSAGAASPVGAAPVRAVVALADGVDAAALQLPGVTVLRRLPSIGAAVVAATPRGLDSLRRSAGVLGVSPDDHLATSSKDHPGDLPGVLAAEELGGRAGRADAGARVTVALLDTGVSDTAALNRASGRLVDGVDTSRLAEGGPALTSGTFVDGYGHGTFMASLIAGGPVPATGHRALGVAPGARVVVVKVADAHGETSLSEVLAGLDWIAAQAPKIQVVNVSLAHERPQAAYGIDPLTAAVEHVQAAGVAVVAAAGNTPGDLGDPGADPQVLTVGAADLTGRRPAVADFSGSGVVAGVAKPDLVASGVRVLGAAAAALRARPRQPRLRAGRRPVARLGHLRVDGDRHRRGRRLPRRPPPRRGRRRQAGPARRGSPAARRCRRRGAARPRGR